MKRVSAVLSGLAEPAAASIFAWLAISSSSSSTTTSSSDASGDGITVANQNQLVLIGQLALLLVALRVVLALILVVSGATHDWHRHAHSLGESNESRGQQSSAAKQSPKTNLRLSLSLMATPQASAPLRVRLLLGAAPFNLEVMQCIPWLTTRFDGLPSIGVMALSSALSLSHGASLLLLQVWFLILRGFTGDTAGVLTLVILSTTIALTVLAFGRLGMVRSFMLWRSRRSQSRASRNHKQSLAPETSACCPRSSGSTNAFPSGSSLSKLPGRQHSRQAASRRVSEAALRANDDSYSILLAEPQRYAVHLRALERQQTAARRIAERTDLTTNQLQLDPTTRMTAHNCIRPMAVASEAAQWSSLNAATANTGVGGAATPAPPIDSGLCDSVDQVGDDDSSSPMGSSRSKCVARAAAANNDTRLARVSRARSTNELTREGLAERRNIAKALASSNQDQGSADLAESAVARLRNAKATNRVRRTRALLSGSALTM